MLSLSSCGKEIVHSNTPIPSDLIVKPNALRPYPNDPTFGATVNYTIKLQEDYKQLEAKDTALIEWVETNIRVDIKP